MSEKYDVIIIGAGIGGLTCGCYLAKAGLKVLIVEQHDKPGGYCTSFKRRGFKFDAAVHKLGSVKRGVLSAILSELDLTNKIKFLQSDPTDRIITPNNTVLIRANPYETVSEFKKSFPEQKQEIDKFFELILDSDIVSIATKIKKLTFKELLNHYFIDSEIQSLFSILLASIGSSSSQTSALSAAIFFREFILDPGYYPEGGIQSFPDTLANLIKTKGCELIYSKKATKILVNNNAVSGVIIDNEMEISSRIVVSNIDATFTYSNLLSDSEVKENKTVQNLKPSSSAFALYLGLKRNLSKLHQESSSIWFSETLDIDSWIESFSKEPLNLEIPYVLICFPTFYEKKCDSDKAVVQIFTNAPYKTKLFWDKNRIQVESKMIELLKKAVPGITEDDFELKLSATPRTFNRYTNNRDGAIYGWESNLEQLKSNLVPQESSLSGLILCGHWCTSGFGSEGGVPGAATIGRNAARIIYDKFQIKWPWKVFILK
ncbi:MAG: NAD(P)/FAD-dependent oxidoreductase [Candidatus Omnitrophica bacterium]|nr:NAD(P)/FAD-dependent oxidoreductase [Candidatus Omnitrophota bacterium]